MRGRDLGLTIGLIVVIVLGIALLSGGWVMGPGMMGRYGGYAFGYAPWWGIGMGIGMLVFWVLIIAGGVALVASVLRRDRLETGAGSEPARPRPLDILKERYARGEITREQYDQMRHDLEAS